MINRKITYYTNGKIDEIEVCGKKLIHFSGGMFELPFMIEPTDGEHNYESCVGCRKYRKGVVKTLKKHFEKFPHCCEKHSNLSKHIHFDKKDFNKWVELTADKIMFTHHHIINHLENEDWYEDITNYIEYAIESLGSFPTYCGSPFLFSQFYNYLIHLSVGTMGTANSQKVSKKELDLRANKILSFIKSRSQNSDTTAQDDSDRDFNLLLTTYDKWYKAFPFELSYFKHLQNHFQKTLPIVEKDSQRYNKYLERHTATLSTKQSLTLYLLNITKLILSNINGLKLYEKGLLTNAEKVQLELIIQNRKLELSEIEAMDNTDRKGYIKTLKKWFASEKKFIQDIKPFVAEAPNPSNNSTARPNRTDIAYYAYFKEQTKTLNINHPFPSELAWKEIGEKFGKNWKNIQQAYNIISTDSEERLKPSRKRNIKYVIDNMLSDAPKARELAKDELNLAEIKS